MGTTVIYDRFKSLIHYLNNKLEPNIRTNYNYFFCHQVNIINKQ